MAKKIILSDGEYSVVCKILRTPTNNVSALEDGVDMYYYRELKTHILGKNYRFPDTDDTTEKEDK